MILARYLQQRVLTSRHIPKFAKDFDPQKIKINLGSVRQAKPGRRGSIEMMLKLFIGTR